MSNVKSQISNIDLAAGRWPLAADIQEHGANVTEIAKLNNCKPSQILDFSSSINPLGPSKAAELAIVENLGGIANYPEDNNDLTQALSNYLGVNQSNLFIDNGSAAIIYKLFAAFDFKMVNIIEPTFSEYKKAAEAFGCHVHSSLRATKGSVAISEIASSQAPRNDRLSKAIFICNPNNPTAKLITKEEIESIAYQASRTNTLLVVDEAFMDFVEEKEKYSAIDLVAQFSNLIVISSLTKFFALAGLRIGYLCANQTVIEKINKVTPPWPMNILTLKAALASLNDFDYIKTSKAQVKILREDLLKQLDQIENLETYTSEVNFLLVKIKKGPSSTNLYQELAKKKILIRDCASFGMGSNFIRLAVKTPRDHKTLVSNLREGVQS